MKRRRIRIVNKEQLNKVIDEWLKEYKVFAPLKKENLLLFSQVNRADEVILNSVNTKNAAKEIFLPQSEVLFNYKFFSQAGFQIIPERKEKKKYILLGVRPCDAKVIKLLDNVFSTSQYQDVYFNQRRENSIIIGLACLAPQSTCFCTWVNGGPFAREGSDIFLIEIGEDYLLEILTDKGEKLVGIQNFPEADQEKVKLAEKVETEIKKKMRVSPIQDISEKLDKMFEHPLWKEIHQRCFGCGVCTYLCPTCYCFDIQDLPLSPYQGKRIRSWDSCMFSLFSLQASGHNPRPSLKQRLRQRIMHKFNYFVQNYGILGCVGCGRCIRNCPAGIDVREIIQQILTVNNIERKKYE